MYRKQDGMQTEVAKSFTDISIAPAQDRASDFTTFGVSVREFLKQPMAVGSAFPASRYMIDRMLEPIDWSRIRTVVEFGPGTGVFTRALLERLPADAHLLAIDTSEGFIDHLEATIADPRLIPVQGSAADAGRLMQAHGLAQADCIVSGLPFSTVSPEVAERIMDVSRRVLTRDGHFLAYQMRSAVHPLLVQNFLRVEKGYEWRNVPPCHLYWARQPWKEPAW